jgi:hypothetical protein
MNLAPNLKKMIEASQKTVGVSQSWLKVIDVDQKWLKMVDS